MRKQIKVMSILSTAAFLTMCFSLISFAANGWTEENNVWSYYDENGERVTESWIKEGDQWYWLDADGFMVSEQWVNIADENGQYWYYFQKDGSACKNSDNSDSTEIDGKNYMFDAEGRMVTDKLLQIKDDYYYFKKDGSMAKEEWVGIPNENADDEDEPEQYWYYFQKNGKAYKRSDRDSGSIQAKTINGKKYAFDSEGRMLYGWVSDGERQTGDDAWQYSDYYFGLEDNGAMHKGWARLPVDPDSVEDVQPGSDYWEDIDYRWFYFNANGKKVKAAEDDYRLKTINGNRYGFDEYGRMIVSWYADPKDITLATNRTEANAEGKGAGEYQGQTEYSKKFVYFGTPEAGAKYIKGWFTAVPSEYLMKSKYDEMEKYTYYADKDGNICVNEIKTIDGERYGFDNYGRILSGLVCVKMESENTAHKIDYSFYSDATTASGKGPFEDLEDFDELVEEYAEDFQNHKMRFYWFGGLNGAMVTGKQKVPLSKGGETYEFMFETSGRYKGCGVYGEKNGRLYKAGKLIKPEEGEKYVIIKQTYETLPEDATAEEKTEFAKKDLDGNGRVEGILTQISVEDFISEVCNSGIDDEKKDETVWTVRYNPEDVTYYLVNSSGDIVKNKKNAQNDDGYKFYVKNKKILTVTADY